MSVSRAIVVALLLAAAAILAVAASGTERIEEQLPMASWAMALFLLACLALVSMRYGARGLFGLRLGPWFFAYAAVAFGVASLTALDPLLASRQVSIELIPGALGTLAGSFALCAIGYQLVILAQPISLPIRAAVRALGRLRSSQPRAVGSLYSVFAVAILADALTIVLTGQYGYLGEVSLVTVESTAWYTQPLSILSSLKLAAIFGITLIALSPHQRRRILTIAPALVVAIPLGVLTGSKENFVDIVLAVLIAYVFVRGRVRIVALLLAATMFLFVVTPIVTQLRNDVRSDTQLSAGEAIQLGWERIVADDGYLQEVDFEASALQILGRVRQVDNYVVIAGKTPAQIPHRDGAEVFAAPFTGIVPRLIWADKPVRLSGYEFYTQYYGGQTLSSSAITPQGSLYMYWGVPGLFVGMFVIGLLLRALDDGLNARRNIHGALLLVFIAPIVTKQELDVPGFLANIAIFAITWIAATIVVFRRNPRNHGVK